MRGEEFRGGDLCVCVCVCVCVWFSCRTLRGRAAPTVGALSVGVVGGRAGAAGGGARGLVVL